MVVSPFCDAFRLCCINGVIPFMYKGKWGLFSSEGKMVLSHDFDEIGWLQEGLILTERKGKYELYNEKGERVLPFEMDTQPQLLENGWLAAEYYGAYGIYDTKGKVILKPQLCERPSFRYQRQ